MKMVICSIRDSKSEVFSQPMFFQADGQAVRAFSDAVNGSEDNNNFAKHPDDYTLFRIGFFDDVTGIIEPIPPETLGNGAIFVQGVVRTPRLKKEG